MSNPDHRGSDHRPMFLDPVSTDPNQRGPSGCGGGSKAYGGAVFRDAVEAVFHRMLAEIRGCADTPLRCGIDGLGMAGAALTEFTTRMAADTSGLAVTWPMLEATLEELLDQSLVADEPPCRLVGPNMIERIPGPVPVHDARITVGDVADTHEEMIQALGAWIDRVFRIMCDLDPISIEVVARRADGWASRDIARSTGLGLRLVRRILDELRAALKCGEVHG